VKLAETGEEVKQAVPLEARLFLLDHVGISTAKPLARLARGSLALRGAGGNHRRSLPRDAADMSTGIFLFLFYIFVTVIHNISTLIEHSTFSTGMTNGKRFNRRNLRKET
jgi:hypothetical protein